VKRNVRLKLEKGKSAFLKSTKSMNMCDYHRHQTLEHPYTIFLDTERVNAIDVHTDTGTVIFQEIVVSLEVSVQQ
jgi:hypothetical protein